MKAHSDTPEMMTQSQAARALGLSAQGIAGLARQEGAPVKLVKGKTMLMWPDFPRWRDAKKRPADIEEARRRRESAEAELAELKLERERGRLVDKSVVDAQLEVLYGRIRARFMAIPAKYAPICVGQMTVAEAKTRLDEMVAELMDEMRDGGVD
jgi:hypothetical protein